jgi:hypothetical protein
VTGETCSGPGGTCNCPANQKPCGNLCIPDSACCSDTDCPSEANTTGTDCSGAGGSCQLTCNATCSDINKVYTDGCECCEDANSSCGGTNLGTLGIGNTGNGSGKLPGNSADWFTVTFTGQSNIQFHPSISLTGDTGVVFDIYTDCSGTTSEICGNENGNCVGKTTWETQYTCQNASPSCTVNGQQSFIQSPVGTVYVKVYRASGAPTCNSFALSISN